MKGLVVVTLMLLLAGCGGDGGGGGVEIPEFEPLASDPNVERLVGIVERANTLLVPAIEGRYAVSGTQSGPPTPFHFREIQCSDVVCVYDGETLSLTDLFQAVLIDAGPLVSVSDANLQTRADGFNTVSVAVDLNAVDIEALLPGFAVDEVPGGLGYGFWGDQGMAGLYLADGSFSGVASGFPVGGEMSVAIPFVFGYASGTNPVDGTATWNGIAEMVSTRSFRRQEGTVTLTIPDLALSQPTIGVEILDDDGFSVDKPSWADIPLVGGGFGVGAAGDDYLQGNLFGDDHVEAYGVFDTDRHTGAFGAKREEAPQPEVVSLQ